MKKQIFFLILLLSLCSCFSAYAGTKAVTYFGNEWPVNFLNCEHAQAEEDFARIKKDGFDSLIYCVPWREIQPEADGTFDEEAIARLDAMAARAEKAGLGIYVRLGYTWDYGKGLDIQTRYQGVFEDEKIRRRWLDYAARMYRVLSSHSNYRGAFLTWEDFWPFLGKICSTYEEMDGLLLELLSDTQQVWPGLSMECRLHNDYYNGSWHSHESTFGCAGAPYSSAMLAVSMGWPDNTLIPTDQALASSAQMIERMKTAGKPVFIDQFLYTESTPGFETLARPADTNAYLAGMGTVFRKNTIGYGLWTYKDYADNIVYNPEFGLGEKSWNFKNASVYAETGNKKACIEAGGSISQDLAGRGFNSTQATKVRLKAENEAETVLTVKVGDCSKTVCLAPGSQTVTVEFPTQCKGDITVSSSGKVYIDDVKVYSHITVGDIYKIDGTPGPYLEGIRALNRRF